MLFRSDSAFGAVDTWTLKRGRKGGGLPQLPELFQFLQNSVTFDPTTAEHSTMGVTKETLREGDGKTFPKKGDRLKMHYKGTLASNGQKVNWSCHACMHTCMQQVILDTPALTHYLLPAVFSIHLQFDSSYDRGRPFEFVIGIGQVIKGWDEGGVFSLLVIIYPIWTSHLAKIRLLFALTLPTVMQMSIGEKAKLNITSDYGYGQEGAGNVIPPGEG